jgi:hypothetical protein
MPALATSMTIVVGLDGLAHLHLGGGDQHLERTERKLPDAQLAELADHDIEGAERGNGLLPGVAILEHAGEERRGQVRLEGLQGDRVPAEVAGAVGQGVAGPVDLDVETRGVELVGLTHPLAHLGRAELGRVRPEAVLDFLELGDIQQVEVVDHMLLEQIAPGAKEQGQGQHRRQRIPEGQACADRLHSIW